MPYAFIKCIALITDAPELCKNATRLIPSSSRTALFYSSVPMSRRNKLAAMDTVQMPRDKGATHNGKLERLPEDLARVHILMVNAYLFGDPSAGERDWVLVDGGLPHSASQILHAAERRYGPGARPRAIVLTHGHFDHVGALHELLRRWDVPVYAHELELPYLTGRSDYPPPDPTVGGGLVARSSFLYPRRAINLGDRVHALPADGSVPHMPGWRWIHAPGHSPGQIAFFRDSDRVLLAGDAFCTQKQESLLSVVTEYPKVHGPPKYFTIDWDAARESVRRLAALHPSLAATGHGIPMGGDRLESELQELARRFDELAMPARGRYLRAPALADEHGVLAVPPPVPDPALRIAVVATLAVIAGVGLFFMRRRSSRRPGYF
jgi:glyoxylase-like metal-dependent hydrolase (beta-lactamase superfamily II)